MIKKRQALSDQVKGYCAQIGKDPLLVQGAGGNISWKQANTLWIKASGTSLGNALEGEIFVPLNLELLRKNYHNEDLTGMSNIVNGTSLRPSIETMMHALMPHKIVLHLHAVEILAHLVRVNPRKALEDLLGDSANWTYLEYFKPGADLANALRLELIKTLNIDVIFLKNHGVVIGGNTIDEIDAILSTLVFKLRNPTISLSRTKKSISSLINSVSNHYEMVSDSELNQLAINPYLFSRLQANWVLYPDHVVFLGKYPVVFKNLKELENYDFTKNTKPPFLFIFGVGVYGNKLVSFAQRAQLRCYFDVLIRQLPFHELDVLPPKSIDSLISWQAEEYRKGITGSH